MRWHIVENRKAIEWELKPGEDHIDDIELSGYQSSCIVRYGMSKGQFFLLNHVFFPTLRRTPNNTEATYWTYYRYNELPRLMAFGELVTETLEKVRIDGVLNLFSRAGDLLLTRQFYPSTNERALYERVTVTNTGASPIPLTVNAESYQVLNEERGPMGMNRTELFNTLKPITLQSGESTTYANIFFGRTADEPQTFEDADTALLSRIENVARLTAPMTLDTGDETFDTMFQFAKIHAGECVFRTRFHYGLMHSPGGFRFYSATWCNDQVEYSGPYLSYTGDPALREAAMNAYRMYMPFMSDSYKMIPSSVIAEGLDYWCGVGDRGDAAMYLYGASRFVLSTGNEAYAKELMPAIRWCAEYCRRKMNDAGAVESDSDENENHSGTGKANLSTSSLAYGGFRAAAEVVRTVDGDEETAKLYTEIADKIEYAIEHYFGANIHGLDTYQYFDGCDVFRSWMCMPLCVGIYNRSEATTKALTSDYLLRDQGILITEGVEGGFHDRSLLYSLRGMFASGHPEEAMPVLKHYNESRLIGERVPYAVEGTPNLFHLSAESGLYCKVVLEGLLDILPLSLRSFSIKPVLPSALDHLTLSDIHAYGTIFTVAVTRSGFTVTRCDGKELAHGRLGEKVTVSVL